MLPAAWMMIKDYLVQETKDNKLPVYQDKATKVQTIKRSVFVTPDKRIQLATVERKTDEYHKFDQIKVYTREHIIITQCVFLVFFGIGAHIHHPNPESGQDKSNRNWERNQVTDITYRLTSVQHTGCAILPLSQAQQCVDSNVATDFVMRYICINTLTQLPGEDM
jgi:hypothetical protein